MSHVLMLVKIDDQVTVQSGSDYRDQVLFNTIEDIPFVKEISVYTPLDDKGEIHKLDFDYAYDVAVLSRRMRRLKEKEV